MIRLVLLQPGTTDLGAGVVRVSNGVWTALTPRLDRNLIDDTSDDHDEVQHVPWITQIPDQCGMLAHSLGDHQRAVNRHRNLRWDAPLTAVA